MLLPPLDEDEGSNASADQRNEPDLRSESQSVCHHRVCRGPGVTVSGEKGTFVASSPLCQGEREALIFPPFSFINIYTLNNSFVLVWLCPDGG